METVTAWASTLADHVAGALAVGSPIAYLFVFLAGILASLTPCVYPMIPVTIAVIGGQTRRGPKEGFFLSLVYCIGIALTYALLGAGLAALGRATERALGQGSLAQSPWVALGIGVICLIFAMVMFGTLTIPMPARLQQWQGQRRGGNYVGALAAGMVFGTVASPCLAPVVGLIAVETAKTGRVLYGGTMLFTFGLGLGVLFLIIGTFSGALTSLPKAGAWMDRIKNAFGWLMLAIAAGYFFHAGSLQAAAQVRAAERTALTEAMGDSIEPGDAIDTTGPPPYTVIPGSLPSVGIGATTGAPAVDAPLLASDGSRTSLAALWAERTVVLVFSAHWCSNCPREVPHVNEAFHRYGDEALFLEVGTTQASSVTLNWARRHGVEYPLVFDTGGDLLAAYNPEDPMGLPWTVVIARDGTLLYRGVEWPLDIGSLIDEGNSREPSTRPQAPPEEDQQQDGAATEIVMAEGEVVEPGAGPYAVPAGTGVEPSEGEGAPAPEVKLQDIEGQVFTLADWRGQYGIVLALYSGRGWEDTRRIPSVNALARASRDGLKVLGFSGATSPKETLVWGAENGVEHDLVYDRDDVVRRAFATEETLQPVFVFINLDGTVIYQGQWPGDAAALELASAAMGG